ncbi:MAG: hypothetical protein [Caudoviricetes sp.]|nr:MAG: hypothetical protein [Caudoviricetes sp.]
MRELSEAQQVWAEHVNNLEAVAAARNDAHNYGAGWVKVGSDGNLERIDPKEIIITYRQEKAE